MHQWNRRSFLQLASGATAGTLLTKNVYALAPLQTEPAKPVAANDHIQIALIGAGGRARAIHPCLQVPGVKLVAVADCYDGCLEHAREFWGTRYLHHPRL